MKYTLYKNYSCSGNWCHRTRSLLHNVTWDFFHSAQENACSYIVTHRLRGRSHNCVGRTGVWAGIQLAAPYYVKIKTDRFHSDLCWLLASHLSVAKKACHTTYGYVGVTVKLRDSHSNSLRKGEGVFSLRAWTNLLPRNGGLTQRSLNKFLFSGFVHSTSLKVKIVN